MKNSNIFSAVANAFKGITYFFTTEKNGHLQLMISVLMLVMSFVFEISAFKWALVVLLCVFVMGVVMMNAITEKTCERITTEHDERIKIIKDMTAGAVLFFAVFAEIIGLIIFIYYIKEIMLQPVEL